MSIVKTNSNNSMLTLRDELIIKEQGYIWNERIKVDHVELDIDHISVFDSYIPRPLFIPRPLQKA